MHFMVMKFACLKPNKSFVLAFLNEDLDIPRDSFEVLNDVAKASLKRKVLIVEDNELNREILKAALQEDYDVMEAVNGEEGLKILSRHYKDISIILLDVVMPVCDGFEFLKRQKTNPLLSNVPVIVTTGSNSQEDELKCLELGAVDFITKPYNATIVKGRINSVIKLKESAMTLAAVERDELTGLYTKQAFFHHAKTFMSMMPNESFNVIAIDITDFKLTNSTYGTKMGDEVLVYLGKFLSYYFKDALLARYESDKFLAFYNVKEKLYISHAEANLEKIMKNSPVPNIRIKCGIYENVDTSLPISIICDRALMTVKTILNDYTSNIAFFTEQMNQKQLLERQMENDFHKALINHEFKVYFQPKYSTRNEKIVGAEALVRWQKEDGQVISPGMFVPLFERDGLIVHLDEYVFEHVCKFQKQVLDNHKRLIPISVNLSRASIHYNNVVGRYLNIVKENQIPLHCIPIELTESAALYSSHIQDITQKIVDAGFLLHIDDFGSGYSSLTTLNDLKFTTLKIDKSLIDHVLQNRGHKIVQQAINLAHGLDMETVAEGVESKNQADCLKRMGCDEIQGFYYSKPLPWNTFYSLIEKAS